MKKILLFLMFAMFCIPWAANAQNTLTVCDGTVSEQHIPVYAYSGDTQGTTSEFIIPAANLTAMNGMEISAISFYVSQNQSKTWTAIYQVYMTEVAATTLESTVGPNACTVVYTGTSDDHKF